MRAFVHYELSHVVERLRAFAAEAGLEREPTIYVLSGQRLIARQSLIADSAQLMRTLSRHRQMVSVELPFAAEQVVVRVNARVLGLQALPGLTAKIRLPRQPRVGQSFVRDCVARRFLIPRVGGEGWSIPRIYRRGPRAGWLIEDQVAAETANPGDIERFVTCHALSLYEISARMRPLARSGHHAWLVQELSSILKEITPGLAAVSADAQWPVGICHGDLYTGNLLKGGDGHFWLVDWERAGVRPIVVDLAYVYLQTPALKSAILDVLHGLDPDRMGTPPVQQLALGAAFELRRRSHLREAKIDRNARITGQRRSEAAADFDRQISRYRAAVAALAE